MRKIIRQQGEMPETVRKDKMQIDPELLRRLYDECRGWAERVHEKLQEEENIQVGYSTLTRMLRELGLGKSRRRAAIACRTSRAPRCNTILRITTCRWQGNERRSSPACSTCVTRSGAT